MRTIELFSGTQSFSKVMREKGFKTCCIDNNPDFDNDITIDILELDSSFIRNNLDMLWASPPCTAFSVASIGKHWTGGHRAYIPKTDFAKLSLDIIEHTIKIIADSKPKYWFIENPRGVLRKLINPLFEKYNIVDYHRVTVWYCQYGDSRAKPTDIWTNLKGWSGKQCKNNSIGCNHIRAPRGAKTGTQGLKGAKERSVIPRDLFIEILDHKMGLSGSESTTSKTTTKNGEKGK